MYNNATPNVNMNPAGGANEDDSEESGSGWISWFCDLEGHEFFIEVRRAMSICIKKGGC
jgi:hypothetical protein